MECCRDGMGWEWKWNHLWAERMWSCFTQGRTKTIHSLMYKLEQPKQIVHPKWHRKSRYILCVYIHIYTSLGSFRVKYSTLLFARDNHPLRWSIVKLFPHSPFPSRSKPCTTGHPKRLATAIGTKAVESHPQGRAITRHSNAHATAPGNPPGTQLRRTFQGRDYGGIHSSFVWWLHGYCICITVYWIFHSVSHDFSMFLCSDHKHLFRQVSRVSPTSQCHPFDGPVCTSPEEIQPHYFRG